MRSLFRLTVVLLLVAGWSAPAHASRFTADLKPFTKSVTGKVGSVVKVPLRLHNYGPDPTGIAQVTFEYTAPRGTRFVKDFSAVNGCTVISAHTKVRCFMGATSYYPTGGAMGASEWWPLELKIVSTVTAPGRYRVICPCDPNTGNNSALIVVNGVRSAVKPTPKPSLSPSASPPASPSPSPSVEPSPSAEPVPDVTTAAIVPVSSGSAERYLAGGAVGVGVLAVVLAAVAGVLHLRRRRASVPDGSTAATTPPQV